MGSLRSLPRVALEEVDEKLHGHHSLKAGGVEAFPSMIPEGGMQLRRCHLIASRLE
jgi:hypothetical protein